MFRERFKGRTCPVGEGRRSVTGDWLSCWSLVGSGSGKRRCGGRSARKIRRNNSITTERRSLQVGKLDPGLPKSGGSSFRPPLVFTKGGGWITSKRNGGLLVRSSAGLEGGEPGCKLVP